MFVVTLTYRAELEAIDEAMKRHVAYLKKGYAEGVFRGVQPFPDGEGAGAVA